jgi:two-component system, sensor histidine kinase and response regulator
MFIENNFNDFLSKPIDVSKLDEILNRWISKDKRDTRKSVALSGVNKETHQSGSFNNVNGNNISGIALASQAGGTIPNISGVDTAKGIAMTGGTVDNYVKVLSLFCKDIEERLSLLQKPPSADTMSAFITNVHALRSASASVGVQEISNRAAEFETAGKAADMIFIREHLSEFAKQLTALVKNIRNALESGKPEYHDVPQDSSGTASLSPLQSQLFNELAEALKLQKVSEIKRILNMLEQQEQDSKLKKILEQISDQVLMTEFDSALKIIDEALRA